MARKTGPARWCAPAVAAIVLAACTAPATPRPAPSPPRSRVWLEPAERTEADRLRRALAAGQLDPVLVRACALLGDRPALGATGLEPRRDGAKAVLEAAETLRRPERARLALSLGEVVEPLWSLPDDAPRDLLALLRPWLREGAAPEHALERAPLLATIAAVERAVDPLWLKQRHDPDAAEHSAWFAAETIADLGRGALLPSPGEPNPGPWVAGLDVAASRAACALWRRDEPRPIWVDQREMDRSLEVAEWGLCAELVRRLAPEWLGRR